MAEVLEMVSRLFLKLAACLMPDEKHSLASNASLSSSKAAVSIYNLMYTHLLPTSFLTFTVIHSDGRSISRFLSVNEAGWKPELCI